MPTSQRRPVNKHSKCKTHRRKAQRRILHGLLLVFAALMLCFGLFLWKAALELNAPAEPAVSAAEDDFRPVVGDPRRTVWQWTPDMAAVTRAQGEWSKKNRSPQPRLLRCSNG